MFSGKVQTDRGETLNIMYPDGQTGGNPILIFWTELSNYCNGKGTEHIAWFKSAEGLLDKKLCSFCQPLINSLCDGEWNYHEEDYDIYLMSAGESKLSLEEFLRYVNKNNSSWVDIQPLTDCVERLIDLLKSISESNSQWDETSAILKDFEALYSTLLLLTERKTSQVRIGIT